jgi:hypothetical protein
MIYRVFLKKTEAEWEASILVGGLSLICNPLLVSVIFFGTGFA